MASRSWVDMTPPTTPLLTTDKDNNTLMYIQGDGRVGIGTTTPANPLVVKDGTNVDMEFLSETNGVGIQSYNRTSSAYGYIRFNSATSGGETARMDTSGNLLVGTTNTGANHASNGAYITSSGQLMGRTTGIVSYLNRRGSDGQILQFMKDGTSVGSIGAYVSRLYVGNDDTFLTFEGAADRFILPLTRAQGETMLLTLVHRVLASKTSIYLAAHT